MRTARERNLRIAGMCPVLQIPRIVRSDDVPCRREDTDNAIPGSSRFAPFREALARYPWRLFFPRGTNRFAGSRDQTGDPKCSARKNAERETRPSYTGKPKGTGGLSFFDRNCGRNKEEEALR